MNNFREVNDDILKDWLSFREETELCFVNDEDRKHTVEFDEISERILKNVPKQNKKYVEKQLINSPVHRNCAIIILSNKSHNFNG